jgi:molybdopterin/thiamine biosynthesis adenylyltransferase
MNFHDELIRLLKKSIDELEKIGKTDLDIFDVLELILIPEREDILCALRKEICEKDPKYEEDPNPIMYRTCSSLAILEKGKLNGKIGFDDLVYRSIGDNLTREDLEKLRSKTIAFCGVGGMNQSSIMLLARLGLGGFILIDPDNFESSNASRQWFCFSPYLGEKKVEVVSYFIQNINSDAKIIIHPEKINEKNIHNFLSNADYIYDGLDNKDDRILVSDYARMYNKPWFHTAVGGREGRYLLFMPEDPPYKSVFKHSHPKPQMGMHPLVTALLACYEVNDTLKLVTGKGEPIRYPLMLTVNMDRLNPAVIRKINY